MTSVRHGRPPNSRNALAKSVVRAVQPLRAMAKIVIVSMSFIASIASAEPLTTGDIESSLAVNLGLIQPLVLKGANVEVDYRRGPLVVGYSHGWSLEFAGATAVGEVHDQHLRLHVPYSTGVGIGVEHYFAGPAVFIDVRAELKLHRFEPWLEDVGGITLRALPAYHTVTAGGGIYATWLPWHHVGSRGGVDVSASLRVWPKVWDSLGDYSYENETTGRMETMHAANIGIANTPFLANISVGYLFE